VQPLSVTEDDYQSYCIVAEVLGGGVSAQSEALRLGISKLLCMFNPSVKTLLRKAGLLTRDARIVEPKKTGQPKARKKEQYSKR
jgi:small subunit ribosomal protein S9